MDIVKFCEHLDSIGDYITADLIIEKYAKKAGKPILDFKGEAEYADAYNEFYDLILEESTVLTD